MSGHGYTEAVQDRDHWRSVRRKNLPPHPIHEWHLQAASGTNTIKPNFVAIDTSIGKLWQN